MVDHDAARASALTISSRGETGLGWSIDAWANAGRAEAAKRPHDHGGAFWSAVYDVSVADGDGGDLALNDPRLPGLLMLAPELHFTRRPGSGGAHQDISGADGRVPGWLTHSFEPCGAASPGSRSP